MRIKNHPRVFVDVYVDGRVQVLVEKDTTNIRDAIKIGLIEGAVRKVKSDLAEHLEPGRYEAFMTKFNWFKKDASIDLIPV